MEVVLVMSGTSHNAALGWFKTWVVVQPQQGVSDAYTSCIPY